MDILTLVLAVTTAALGSGGLVSWLHLRTTRDKDISQTDKNVADAQGVIIASLQKENERLSGEVRELRRDVAELRGQYKTLENFKVKEIAQHTAIEVAKLLGIDQDGLSLED